MWWLLSADAHTESSFNPNFNSDGLKVGGYGGGRGVGLGSLVPGGVGPGDQGAGIGM